MTEIAKQSTNGRRGGARPNTGGRRPGAGRPHAASDAEREALEEARREGRTLVPKALEVWRQALDATTWEVSDRHGWREVPDLAMRLRAAKEIADRFGLPVRQELEHSIDPSRAMLEQLARVLAE